MLKRQTHIAPDLSFPPCFNFVFLGMTFIEPHPDLPGNEARNEVSLVSCPDPPRTSLVPRPHLREGVW